MTTTTHDTRSLDETLDDMRAHANDMVQAIHRASDLYRERLAALPVPDVTLAELLHALAIAAEHQEENFRRWPREVPHDHPDYPFRKGTECYADWFRACDEHQLAVTALTNYARALHGRGRGRS